jgi:trk system potassium uptake protein
VWSFRRRRRRRLSPPEVFAGSFLALIVAGTLALKLLPGISVEQELSWTDAVFTSTSAVCVTGLIVVDTATDFTFRGQLLLLVLIQLGGLGMLTLTSMIIATIGGRPSLRSETLAASGQQAIPYVPTRALIIDVVKFTVLIEGAGTLLLYGLWAPRLGWTDAIWPAAFHSISAFCNAGFSTYSDSVIGYQNSPATLLVLSLLITAGGLGFVAIEECVQRFSARHGRSRLSTHTRLVLWSSAALVAAGWLLFCMFEWNGVFGGWSVLDKLSNGLFMSVTARTAGFNTIDYAQATDSSSFLTMLLMMIGGAPGSTAGGIKTTTFALLGLLAWSRLRSQSSVTFANRSIPEETLQRAVGLVVIATATVVAGIFLLASIDTLPAFPETFLLRSFEVVSAFNTVGLSMGVTPHLSIPSRWVIIVLMFVGRIGPLSLAAVLRARLAQRGDFRLAHEDVVVG